MVEVSARDTLQPALLDRLTDHDPARKVEGREERVISRAQLRASVLRDLSWLFNSTNLSDGNRNKTQHNIDIVDHEIEDHVHVQAARRKRGEPMDLAQLRRLLHLVQSCSEHWSPGVDAIRGSLTGSGSCLTSTAHRG